MFVPSWARSQSNSRTQRRSPNPLYPSGVSDPNNWFDGRVSFKTDPKTWGSSSDRSSGSGTSGYDIYRQYAQGRTNAGQSGNTGSNIQSGQSGWDMYNEYAQGMQRAWENALQQQYSQYGQMSPYQPYQPPAVDQGLENRALQAALDRIKAEYDIRIAEPESQLNSLAGQYQQAMLANRLQFGEARRQQNSAMADRGLLHSGVRQEEMRRAFAPIESQRREIQNTMAYGEGVDEKDWGTQALQLQAAIEQLRAAEKNAELERRIQAEQAGLKHRLAMAGAGG